MQVIDIVGAGTGYEFTWPGGDRKVYDQWVEYRTRFAAGQGKAEKGGRIIIGFGQCESYGMVRRRVVVWIDRYPEAEFVGADDFDVTGEVLSEIKVPGEKGERICRYPEESVPERYSGFNVTCLKKRISGERVHNAWAVIAHVADHRSLAALAILRRFERQR